MEHLWCGIQSRPLGSLATYIPCGRKSARYHLMAAIHSNVCLELVRFLWFPPVILPPSCLEKSAAAATITCSQSLHPFGFGRGSGAPLFPSRSPGPPDSARTQIVTKSFSDIFMNLCLYIFSPGKFQARPRNSCGTDPVPSPLSCQSFLTILFCATSPSKLRSDKTCVRGGCVYVFTLTVFKAG